MDTTTTNGTAPDSTREGSNTEAAHEVVRWIMAKPTVDTREEFLTWLQGRIKQLHDPKEGRGRGRRRDGYVRLLKTAKEFLSRQPGENPEPPTVVQDFDFTDVLADHARGEQEERKLRSHVLGLLNDREALRNTDILMDKHSFQVWTNGDSGKIGLIGTWDLEVNGASWKWRCKVNGSNLGLDNPAGYRGRGSKAFVESIGRGTPYTFYVWPIRLAQNTLIAWDLHDGKRNTRFVYSVWRNGQLDHLSEAAYKKLAFDLGIDLS